MSQYANGIFSLIQQGRAGNINVEFKKIDSQSLPTIYTKGHSANGIRAVHQGDGEGETRVVVNNAKIDTEGYSVDGVEAWRDGAGGGYGKVYIDISDSEITTPVLTASGPTREKLEPATFSSKRLVARSLRRARSRTAYSLIRLIRLTAPVTST